MSLGFRCWPALGMTVAVFWEILGAVGGLLPPEARAWWQRTIGVFDWNDLYNDAQGALCAYMFWRSCCKCCCQRARP